MWKYHVQMICTFSAQYFWVYLVWPDKTKHVAQTQVFLVNGNLLHRQVYLLVKPNIKKITVHNRRLKMYVIRPLMTTVIDFYVGINILPSLNIIIRLYHGWDTFEQHDSTPVVEGICIIFAKYVTVVRNRSHYVKTDNTWE